METVLIIGAGPAGLTVADLLSQKGYQVIVYESHEKLVGGLAKTEHQLGFHFDLGGHRFYTKSDEVAHYWHNIRPNQLKKRSRLSRIFYQKNFFNYPLELKDVLQKLSWFKGFHFLISYIKAKLLPPKQIKSFEDWVVANFGRELFNAFFKSYTEKVWGRKCDEISKDWAAQRINNLNIGRILLNFLYSIMGKDQAKDIKSLIESFDYPDHGPGQLWQAVKENIEKRGGLIYLDHHVNSITQHDDSTFTLSFENQKQSPVGQHVIATCPLKHTLKNLSPAPETRILELAKNIKYRDFLTVVLMFEKEETFPDNWIYVHDERVQVARIQNYKNWSPHMVPDQEFTSYGLEYFCQQGDDLWLKSDEELIHLAIKEVNIIGLPFVIDSTKVQGKVIRVPYAYPVYDHDHEERANEIKEAIYKYKNLQLIGRCGLHRYNNQDHSIKTAMLAVENIIRGERIYDPWLVNQDAEYLEKK